jgi:hypothetical protein
VNVRNVRVRRLQCDEIRQYVGAKAKSDRSEKKVIGWGDVWTWTGLDADTELCVSYLVGGRDPGWAKVHGGLCVTHSRRVQTTMDVCRMHSMLRVTPAMEAGIADHVWSIEEMGGCYRSHYQLTGD